MILDPQDVPISAMLLKLINIGSASSDWLAAQVVLYRTLSMHKEIAIIAMNELARRRDLGEVFTYEQFIDSEVEKIKQLQTSKQNSFSSVDLKSVIKVINESSLRNK